MATATTTQRDDLIAVPVSLLLASKVLGVSLYMRCEPDGPCKLYRGGFDKEVFQCLRTFTACS